MKLPVPCRFFLGLLAAIAIAPALSAAADPGVLGRKDFQFKRGVNISHWLSQNNAERTYAAAWFSESDIAWIAQQGFDHVRLPVDVRLCVDQQGKLIPAKLKPVEDCIKWSREHGLGVVLDAHFLPGADFNAVGGDRRVYTDDALQQEVAGVWRQLATHFAKEGANLRFEILNEPVAEQNKQLNPFMHRMLAAIRESNPTRLVYLTSNKWSSFSTVPDVELPEDRNIALTIHNYEPFVFTHQRAPWAGFKDTMPAVKFPGKVPDLTGHTTPIYHANLKPGDELTVQQVQDRFAAVETWVAAHRPGLDVYVGEFGAYRAADPESARRWISTIVTETERRGWSWAVWDYKGGFAVRAPDGRGTPILDGLFKK